MMKQKIPRFQIAGVLLMSLGLSLAAPVAAEVDLSGEWQDKYFEDWPERLPGPDIGDYIGLPLNASARSKADSWESSVQTMLERQCIPHPNPYSLRGPADLHIWPEPDPVTGRPRAWIVYGTFGRATHTIWMDGRPHPSKYAAHTYAGFTTGIWEGDMLTTYTTHIKMGYLRRNGVPSSDQATVTEHWVRHREILTVTTVVEDPVYFTEPLVRSSNWQLDLHLQRFATPCEPVVEVVRKPGTVPHYLPGANPFLNDVTKAYHIPLDAVRGGAETMYPEYRKKLKDQYVPPAKCIRYCCGWINLLGPDAVTGKLDCDGSEAKAQ